MSFSIFITFNSANIYWLSTPSIFILQFSRTSESYCILMWGQRLVFQVPYSDIENFSVLKSAVPVYLTIKLHTGINESYQFYELLKNNVFHLVGDQIHIW